MSFLIECLDAQQADHVNNFTAFAYENLGITDHPVVSFEPHLGTTSFGLYNPDEDTVTVAVAGRHISDVLRTFAHELVHHVQMNLGDIGERPIEELEYEANAVAGMLMRDYNKLHPEMFGLAASVPALNSLGDSQGTTFPDTTRPSAPIEFAETAINAAGSGAYASLGVGPAGEPGIGFEVDIDDENNDPDWNATKDHHRSFHGRHKREQYTDTEKRNGDIKAWRATEDDRAYTPIHTIKEDGGGGGGGMGGGGSVVNSAGSGAIAGIGVGPQGEPGVHPRKKKSPILAPMFRRKTFKQLKEEL